MSEEIKQELKKRSKKIAVCLNKLPPCNAICPAGEDIQRWIELAKQNEYYPAWQVILEKNPFPSVHGRVCYHYCETRCNRTQYDSTVNIHCIERFLGDLAIKEGWQIEPLKVTSGKRVLVVGAGPAGLTAAFYLRLLGHSVTIYEALPKPGGMMLVGIPEYRLPKQILFGEIARITSMGVKIEYGHPVSDLAKEQADGNFDAVFLALGAHLGRNLAIPIDRPSLVMDAVEYLREVALGHTPNLGAKMVIYGGGNTAIDVARTARRLGVQDVTIVYHRTKDKMSAFDHEIKDALEEGIKLIFLRSVLDFINGNITVSINELDDKGRPKNTGQTEKIPADCLIFALNQIPDSEFLRKNSEIDLQPNGSVAVDNFFMTGMRGVFAGGDMIPGDRSVTLAVGHGRRAAYHINAYLNAKVFVKRAKGDLAMFEKLHISSDLSSYDKLNICEVKSKTWFECTLSASKRTQSFAEVLLGIDQAGVKHESERCFSCGNCFGCGKCYAICPVNAIQHDSKSGKVTKVDAELCMGCGKCVKVCPCGAMTMVDR